MRRYLPLAMLSLFIVVLVFIGTALLTGTSGNHKADKLKSIVVYTTQPVEEVSALSEEYERMYGVKVNMIPLPPGEIITKIEAAAASAQAGDLILANRSTLQAAVSKKLLVTYASETTDLIPVRFCSDDNLWVGVWYDPIIFAVNKDWLKAAPTAPAKWADLSTINNYRLTMTDFWAADASANLLYTLVANNGETTTFEYLETIHPKIEQYAKFLATPPRMVGMGEADIAIAVQSETLRYVKDGFPVKIIYPNDGTAFLLTGAALLKGVPHEAEAKRFLEWLLKDSSQVVLQKNKFFFVPTNPETKAYKDYNIQQLKLFDKYEDFNNAQKAKLIDKWMKSVRLSPR